MIFDWKNWSYEERLKKYLECKDAYYNDIEIISDIEFDELEKSLGLDNKSSIGAESSYTIEHPIVMGSLYKEQIKNNKNGINWNTHYTHIVSYVNKSKCKTIIITPKYDGCSFEVYIKNKNIISISSRGNKKFGKDIYPFLIDTLKSAIFMDSCLFSVYDEWCIRGEILISKKNFVEKYSSFTNPRSWVSGLTNQKYLESDYNQKEQIKDLSIVIYDAKRKNGCWEDVDWNTIGRNIINNSYLPDFYRIIDLVDFSVSKFEKIYKEFSDYRHVCEYSLDGFVIKPLFSFRPSTNDDRPKDCVAVKYLPYLKTTIVKKIEWKLGKSGELFPIVVFDPIELDNRKVTRASGSNYGNIEIKKINTGAEILVSLAGDIIPYILKVITPSSNTNYVGDLTNVNIVGCHLYEILTPLQISRNKFVSSCKIINIKGLGEKIAKKIFDNINDEKLDNILLCPYQKLIGIIGGKTEDNISLMLTKRIDSLSLQEIIQSCSFDSCGSRTSEECAKYLLNENYNFSGLNYESYSWVFDIVHPNYIKIMNIIKQLNRPLESFKSVLQTTIKIPIIMTGAPSLYSSKKDFLIRNNFYIETTKWNECQILFTNDMDSKSKKMLKAKELGIEIRKY